MKKYFGLFVIIMLSTVVFSACTSSSDSQKTGGEEATTQEEVTNNMNYGGGMGRGSDKNGRGGQGFNKENCLADDCLSVNDLDYPVGELSDDAKKALDMAIDDEYKARAVYDAVMEEHGSIRPFSMIIRAEEQHISALKSIYDKYGLEVPSDNWAGKIEVPESLTAACQIGVEAEIANAELYKEDLLPKVSEYEDITIVFENLMNASQEKHLPAFEKCN